MNEIGNKYSRLEILSVESIGGKKIAICRCDCGVEKKIRLDRVKTGVTVSCGCVKRKHSVDIGRKYGRLTVESIEYVREHGHIKVPVVCECGTRKNVGVTELALGVTKSCGCIVVEQVKKLSYRHGGNGTVLYLILSGMKARCTNEKTCNYKEYGGRGISVCDEWSSDFSAFESWSLNNGFSKGLQIDRIDTNGNYEPSNCRWVTPKENGNNRRNNVLLSAFGETKTMSQWADDERCMVNYPALKQRISKYKWPDYLAITTPSRKYKK